MKQRGGEHFHKLHGVKKTRMTFNAKDFPDYVLMTLLSLAVVRLAYGIGSAMSYLGALLCMIMLGTFLLRHGIGAGIPILVRRPQDVLYMLLYKLQNIQPMFLVAVGLFAVEQWLILLTPSWPHHGELMRKLALYLFYIHFIGISLYRTAVLISHLRHVRTVREVLLQSNFRYLLVRQPRIAIHVVHAYCTGLLTHMILIAPWYLVITHGNLSVLTLPVVCILNFLVHFKYMKGYNEWFYRDHWLGHNSELEFVYLHGTHHDAIPSGLIGVSGNGHLEGFLRHTLGNPLALYNPLLGFLLYSLEVLEDIRQHQYIPGVFPKLARQVHEHGQHSVHHWGRLEPYSIGLRPPPDALARQGRFKFLPEEISNSIALDERLTGFEWDNAKHRQFLQIFDEYQK